MSLKYISRFLLFALLLTLVLGGRSSNRGRGGNQGGNSRGRGGNQGGNQGGGNQGGGNQGGGNQGGGNQGGDDDDDDEALICNLGRTGTFYTNAQFYYAGGGCGCQYGPTRNALRELAAGYLIEFNRHLVDNYGADPNTYTADRFEDWFNEFATDDVQYTTSTGVMTTSYDGLDELTDPDTGFGYQLATGDLDYRVEISPVIMTECDADGEEATFEGSLIIYRIDRNTGCTDGIQQTRSMFTFTADEDMWLVSTLVFVRDDIPDQCDA